MECVAHAIKSGASNAPWSESETGRRLGSKWTEPTTLPISEILWLSGILAGIYRIVLAYLLSSPKHESHLSIGRRRACL